MPSNGAEQYQELMTTIRRRFDVIASLNDAHLDAFSKSEIAAFNGRKIVEAIAFGCLVAVENGLKHIPKDAEGQWNAEKILSRLRGKKIDVFPSPSVLRAATGEEMMAHCVKVTVAGVAERRLTHDDLTAIYNRLHRWLHEINPYVGASRDAFMQQSDSKLWADLDKVRLFMERHFISIGGKGFFCTLWDKNNGTTKVLPLDKVGSIFPQT